MEHSWPQDPDLGSAYHPCGSTHKSCEILTGKGSPFAFMNEKCIGKSTGEVGIGYDHNYVLDCPYQEKDGLKHATKLKDGASETSGFTWMWFRYQLIGITNRLNYLWLHIYIYVCTY